ncbi:MAG: type II secretion system protein [Deltaproteobacteria bacterium]|nr:type II secretion system protein [Deltaproteobacteria bacterium]
MKIDSLDYRRYFRIKRGGVTLIPDQRGFTMIELIVVMVILGILLTAGFFGLKQAIDGYNLAQANSMSTQKAQNALDRITIELSRIVYNSSLARYAISAGSGTSITYTANFGGSDETHTIDLNLNLIRLDTDDTKPIIDGVAANGLQFSYADGNGNPVGATSPDMRLVGIALTVQVIAGVTRTYNTRVTLQQ